ncbi:hypothetical protein [Empedobacter brevis]|uniref:hypothetical protein n=1 Tax=Empedobacter brevis TaxID=247 RepID=UPI00333FCB10
MEQKTLQIKHNKYITISLFIIFIFFIIGLYLFDDGSLKDVIYLYYILIFSIFILFIESLFTKVIMDENSITKKTLLTNKKYFKENITSIEIFQKRKFIRINNDKKFITIGWDFNDYNLFKSNIIKFAEKNNLSINNKEKWWD